MTRTVIATLVVGCMVIATTAWLTLPRNSKQKGDPSKFRFMHCPKCLRESTYSPEGIEKPCLYCEKPLVGTIESVRISGPLHSQYKRMVAFLLVEVNCLLGIVVYLLYHPPSAGEQEFYYTECPKRSCRRRMRYAAGRAGAKAQCPLCKTKFINPTLEDQAAVGR